MTEIATISTAPLARDPLWKRAGGIVLRWIYRITGVAIILAALIVLLAQTDMVRSYMRTKVIDLLNEQLEGTLTFDEVRLDIFRGVVLEHPQLYANGTTVLEADRLAVTYDLAALFTRTVAISRAVLTRPHIFVIRSADRVWNIECIVKPDPDTTTLAPPNINIRVRDFSIIEGTLVVDDRTSKRGDGATFDPLHLSLKALELRAAVRLALADKDYSFAVNHLSFYDEFAKTLDVRTLTLAVRIQPSGLDLQSLSIKLVNTDLAVRARIDGLDVLRHGISDSLLERHPIVGDVETPRVWGPDIRFFFPEVDVTGAYALKAHASFSGKHMEIDGVDIWAGDGHVMGSAKLMQLDDPDKLGVDIKVYNSHASYADVRSRLRFVQLPVLTFLHKTLIESAHLRGHPSDSLWFDVHAQDSPGRIDGKMTLYLAEKRLGYNVDMKVNHGDLSVFANSSLATQISGHVVIRGKGLTFQELEGTYQINLDRSLVAGRPVRRARILAHANGAGQITLDTLFADVTPFRRDTIDEYALTPDDRLVGASGTIDTRDKEHPRYAGTVNLSAMDLAGFFENPSLPQRITGKIDVNAEGIELDSLFGTMQADISEFSLSDRALMPFGLKIKSNRQGETRSVFINAPFLTAHIWGNFQPTNLIAAIEASVSNSIDAVKQRIRYLYPASRYVEYVATPVKPTEASFDIYLSDASPLNILLDSMSISASAQLRGRIHSTFNSLYLDVDTLDVNDLLIQADSMRLESDPIHLSTTTHLSDISTSPRLSEFKVVGRIDSLLVCNGIRIKKPVINLSTVKDSIRVQARAEVNTIAAGIGMTGRFYEDSADLRFDSIHVIVDTQRNLEWRSLRPAQITLREAKFRINDLAVQRMDAEKVVVNGRLSGDECENLSIVVQHFNLVNIPRFVYLEPGHPVHLLDGHVNTLTANINGPWTLPVMDLTVKAVGMRYNGELIGTLETKLRHENRDVTGTVTITNPALKTETKTLDVAVVHLPVDLGFKGVQQRLVDGKSIDISLKANKFALASIEPFLPAIERLQGVANANITVKGTTPDKIELGGNARFKNASFLSSPTNIVYNADGVLHLDGSNLHLDTIVIRNLDRDRRNGLAYASGIVVFDGLRVASLDFTVKSNGILIMNKSSQARSPDIFGDIVIASGSNPIHFYGMLDSPMLQGDINVVYADIVFPKERSSTKSRYTAFEYNRTTDTVRKYNSVIDAAQVRRRTSDTAMHDTVARLSIRDAVEAVVKNTTASFVDVLRYDLNIYLKGRTLLTMVFGFLEILIADLEQVDQRNPLVFTGRFLDNSTNLRGRVRVKEGTSTYKFYKPFQASGTLDFTSGGMVDPQLDLKAVYRGRRLVSDINWEDYRVEVLITGTKQKPIARWSIYRNDRRQEGDSAKITGDALMLIILGKTQDELVSNGQGDLVGQVNASLSAVATSALGDLLGGIGGIVQSAQVDLGENLSQSRLTVSGQLWSDVSYRLSGQISDFAGNSTITISVPFTILSDAEAMRYFMLDVSRSVNNAGNITRYQRLWEIKLGAKLP